MSYRQISAGFLALAFVAFWSMKTLHVLASHHSHADHPVCSASDDRSAMHLHDERYASDDCSICAFVLAVPEIISITALLIPTGSEPVTSVPCYCPPKCTNLAKDTTCLRGPPAVL